MDEKNVRKLQFFLSILHHKFSTDFTSYIIDPMMIVVLVHIPIPIPIPIIVYRFLLFAQRTSISIIWKRKWENWIDFKSTPNRDYNFHFHSLFFSAILSLFLPVSLSRFFSLSPLPRLHSVLQVSCTLCRSQWHFLDNNFQWINNGRVRVWMHASCSMHHLQLVLCISRTSWKVSKVSKLQIV